MKSGGNPRRVRVASSIREALADMIAREVKDPRVREAGFININHVELNSDMSVARVYVSFLNLADSGASDSAGPSARGARARARAMAGLQASAGFLRGPLGRRLRLRHAPSLRFVADDSPQFQQKLRELVRADEERAHPDNEVGDEASNEATNEATNAARDGADTAVSVGAAAPGHAPDGAAGDS